ncbi:MAG: type I 3-dehydroquinate dehydratase [Spirochaetaceae bacterium]|jgi:3-dehydroquinate dehydratase/shikimate dehydrogenase|nr:type I 3-dehydroquinate dehydratase [Spirochaetaceae bacterium]
MSKICLCLTGTTLAHDLEIIEKNRKYVDVAELRVDCLDPDERFHIRRFPEMAGLPVILTIRRESDGGKYRGGEGARISLLAHGLANAFTDPRLNFAYVDLEDYLNVPALEEAARVFGTKIIRSYHNIHSVDGDIVGKLKSLYHVGDELVKIAAMANSLSDVLRMYRASQEMVGMNKTLICMGPFGIPSRILADRFGSEFSYTTMAGQFLGALGQLEPQELSELYRFRTISDRTRIFGITGFPLTTTFSPVFFNTIFKLENTDAVYVPFPTDDVKTFLDLAEALNVSGASVTIPHKTAIIPYLGSQSENLQSIGACNTIISNPHGWIGTNTDALGFSGSLLNFIEKKNLKGKRITIVGAGGVAHAVAAEIHRLEARALIVNRTAVKAKELALPYGFAWDGLDHRCVEHIKKYADIIIQTTSAGMEPHIDEDPLALYQFSGKEVVMDLIYKPECTAFLARAAQAGCRTLNGYDMLIRQAQAQYELFTGKDFPSHLLSRF